MNKQIVLFFGLLLIIGCGSTKNVVQITTTKKPVVVSVVKKPIKPDRKSVV